MQNNELFITSKIMFLPAGMHIIRYANGRTDEQSVDFVSLNVSPFCLGNADFFPAETVKNNTLRKIGDCIIVRVKGEQVGILITEYKNNRNFPPVTLKIDRILTDNLLSAKQQNNLHDEKPEGLDIVLSGHIELQGDVSVSNRILGNPSSNQRIEGFRVNVANMPSDLILAYSCRSAGIANPMIATNGEFVGTRQQSKPITAVAFALGGSKANDYELQGEVFFSNNSPQKIIAGQELKGFNGCEHLVALYLKIFPKLNTQSNIKSSASIWENASKTQIFTN